MLFYMAKYSVPSTESSLATRALPLLPSHFCVLFVASGPFNGCSSTLSSCIYICAGKTVKTVFSTFFQGFTYFSEVLIYSEFKIAEKSLLTERNVAIDR